MVAGGVPRLEPARALPVERRRPLAQRPRQLRPRGAGRGRLRPRSRRRRPGVAPGVRGLRDFPGPVRRLRRARASRLGCPARLGRAADGARAEHPAGALRRRPRRNRAAPRPHRATRREPALPDAVLPGPLDPPLRLDDVRPDRPAARRRRGAPLAARRGAPARDPGGRRSDAQPHRRRARVVPRRPGRERARARLLPLGPGTAVRLRVVVRRPLAAEAELALPGAPPANGGRDPPLARRGPRRLADRRREHDRPLPRRRPDARGGRLDSRRRRAKG